MNPLARIFLRRVRDDWEHLPPRMKPTLAALVGACLQVVIFASPLGSALDSALLRSWFALRGAREVPHSVTVVRIDKLAYARTKVPAGGMLPRESFARAIERIAAAGARLIVLDIFFVAEGENKEADQELARALSASPSAIGQSMALVRDIDPSGNKHERLVRRLPLELFRNSAKAVVPMQVHVSDNNVVERISLPPEVLSPKELSVPLLKVVREFVSSSAVSPGEFDYINYYGKPLSSLSSISFAHVIDDAQMPQADYFKDRVVFIGVTLHATPGLSGEDSFRTPVSNTPMFGVEIHATVAANLLDGSWIRRAPPWLESACLGAFAFFGALVLLRVGLGAGGMFTALWACLWAVASYYSFCHAFRFVPGVTLFLIVFPGVVFVKWLIAASGALIEKRRSI